MFGNGCVFCHALYWAGVCFLNGYFFLRAVVPCRLRSRIAAPRSHQIVFCGTGAAQLTLHDQPVDIAASKLRMPADIMDRRGRGTPGQGLRGAEKNTGLLYCGGDGADQGPGGMVIAQPCGNGQVSGPEVVEAVVTCTASCQPESLITPVAPVYVP